MAATVVADLELDLEIFTGPFDLLLTLVLREEIDLLEVDLADVVLSYIDVLEARGELDLEAATEFLVLIAALLELKSRLMLPREEGEDEEIAPEEALEELLERMLDARRYRSASTHLAELLEANRGSSSRSAPVPPRLRRVELRELEAVSAPSRLGRAIGALLAPPPAVDVRHITMQRVTLAERVDHLRSLLRRGRKVVSFDEAVAGADRVTVCVTLFALLELYKEGEVRWEQERPFADISIMSTSVLEPKPDGEPRVYAPGIGASA